MNLLKNNPLARYAVLTLIMLAIVLLANIRDSLFLVATLALFNLKYLVYDGLTELGIRYITKFAADHWHLVGYFLASCIDLLSVYYAVHSKDTDSGFSILILIVLTPWVLGVSLVLMAINTALLRQSK